jgi:hypothetical protein
MSSAPVHADKYTMTFFSLFLVLLILSITSSYYKYVVLEDFEVFVEVDENGELLLIE